MRPLTDSGSSRSWSDTEPIRSAKTIVTILRATAASAASGGSSSETNSPPTISAITWVPIIELAIALSGKPELLLLDEPTAGMSANETRASIALLQRIAAERSLTLLFTEHDMRAVFSIAQKIAVLHQGRLIAEGTPDQVRADSEVRRVYLGEQR